MRPACGPTISRRSPTSRVFRSRSKRTCATITRSACSRCRARNCCGCTPPPERPASRPSSATRGPISTLWADLMARSLACMGARPGDIFHNAFGYGLFTGGLGFHYGAERLGLTTVPISGGATERQVMLMQDFGPRILGATPSYALNIAEVAQAMGVDLRQLPLRYGCFGAEPWSDAMRGDLEAKFGIKAMDTYGLSEIIGPGVSSECHQAQSGLHLWEDHFFCEVIDPETTEPLPVGEHRRARGHHADQGSAADAALSHPRHHAPGRGAVRVRAHPSPHDAGDRAQRRHADHPRGQRLSVPGRGVPGRLSRARAALPARAHPRRPHGRHHHRGGARPPAPLDEPSSPRSPPTCAITSSRWSA